jgi:hypothetical protein
MNLGLTFESPLAVIGESSLAMEDVCHLFVGIGDLETTGPTNHLAEFPTELGKCAPQQRV